MAATLADDNYKCIFLNEDDRIPIRFPLKFVARSPIDNNPAPVQVMAWRRTAITWTNAEPVRWRIYVALGGGGGGGELTHCPLGDMHFIINI